MVGRTLKHYEIEELLGKGGMGVVYRARDTRLDRPVAIKVLSEELTADADRRRRFQQEARAAGKVTHPAIAQVYDVDEAEGVTFIVMEFVEGQTVRDLLLGRELDLLGALEIGIQVGEGLAKAHGAGIIHRDIKAENIMVTRDGHAKILDFGLAKLLDPVRDEAPEGSGPEASMMETVAKTRMGVVVGTVAYMSPEQARGQMVDLRSDVFSLGILLYEMITGQLPFSGNSPLDTMYAIAFEESQPLSTVRGHLPPSMQRVVNRCLRKRPDDRYPEMSLLVNELKGMQRELETGISQTVPIGDRIRDGLRSLKELTPSEWFWPIAGAVALGIIVGLLIWRGSDLFGVLLTFAIIGLFIWRRVRNRRFRMMKRFTAKVRKMSEVRIIALQGNRVIVLVDRALAKTYVRVNALMDKVNSKMFFGEPFSAVVRESQEPREERALLEGPGVLYVRKDVIEGGE